MEPARPYQPEPDGELDDILRDLERVRRAKRGHLSLVPEEGDDGFLPPLPASEEEPPPPRDPEAPPTIRFEIEERLREMEAVPRKAEFRLTPGIVAALVLGALAAGLWAFVPAGLAPPATRPGDVQYEVSSVRWAAALTGMRIDAHVRDHGRTPASLAAIERGAWNLVEYRRMADRRYRLTMPSSIGPIVHDSMQPREEFLGGSRQVLEGSGGSQP